MTDTLNFLTYTFKNNKNHYRTANLEIVYNKFKGKSGINALWVHVLYDYLLYWHFDFTKYRTRMMRNTRNQDENDGEDTFSRFSDMFEYIEEVYNHYVNEFQLNSKNNKHCDAAKFQISLIIKHYHDVYHGYSPFANLKLIDYTPEYPVIYKTYTPPKRDAYKKYIEYGYKKGHCGLVKTEYLEPYSVWVPELL